MSVGIDYYTRENARLTASEQRALITAARANGDEIARERVMLSLLGLAAAEVVKHSRFVRQEERNDELDDLMQAALVAIVAAVDGWQETAGDLAPYAAVVIRRAVWKERQRAKTQARRRRALAYTDGLIESAEQDNDDKELIALRDAVCERDALYFMEEIRHTPETEDESQAQDAKEVRGLAILRAASLTELQQRVVMLRLGWGGCGKHTLVEIEEALGLLKGSAAHTQARVINKLRSANKRKVGTTTDAGKIARTSSTAAA